ncbi:MAG: hypothetical protein AAB571_06045, partial [Chloroflexota bacterium]
WQNRVVAEGMSRNENERRNISINTVKALVLKKPVPLPGKPKKKKHHVSLPRCGSKLMSWKTKSLAVCRD